MNVIESLVDHRVEVSQSGQVNIPSHNWRCGHDILPIIIDGNSVKLGPKFFSPYEIEELKHLNPGNNMTTFEIFASIDARTRKCEYEFGTFEVETIGLHYPHIRANYTGMHLDGVPSGVGTYETIFTDTIYATIENGERHGFWISKRDSWLNQKEFRDGIPDGLSTNIETE